MTAPTVPPRLARDITNALHRLRQARADGGYEQILVTECHLDRLLVQLSLQLKVQPPTQGDHEWL